MHVTTTIVEYQKTIEQTSFKNLKIDTNPEIETVFNNYPKPVRTKILNLRKIIIEAAEEIEHLADLEETLKWGEAS